MRPPRLLCQLSTIRDSLVLLAVGFLCVPSRPVAAAEEPSLIDVFKKEYPAAAAKLEEAYSHVHIVSTETRRAGGRELWTERVEFRRNGKAIRKDRSVLKSSDSRWPAGGIAFEGTDGTNCFDLFRPGGEREFTLLKDDRYQANETPGITCSPCFAAYAARSMKLSDLLFTNGVRIISAQRMNRQGVEVIEVKTESDAPNGLGVTPAQFSFLPGSYALLDWTISTPTKAPRQYTGALHGHNEYLPDTHPPKLKKTDQWLENAHSPRWEGFENNIDRVDFTLIETKEFRPAAFMANIDPRAAAQYAQSHGTPTTRPAPR